MLQFFMQVICFIFGFRWFNECGLSLSCLFIGFEAFFDYIVDFVVFGVYAVCRVAVGRRVLVPTIKSFFFFTGDLLR